jgi:short-subunit dehydrogenase
LGALLVEQLAQGGFALVLTGQAPNRWRRSPRPICDLEPLAGTDVVVADLATPGGVEILVQALEGRRTDVLANNSGFGSYGALRQCRRRAECNIAEAIPLGRRTYEIR